MPRGAMHMPSCSCKERRIIMFIVSYVQFFLCVLLIPRFCAIRNADFCEADTKNDVECGIQHRFSRKRYILYDVNPPEGFNLRRDVYIRAAMFVKGLVESNKQFQWNLVLPPWGDLYHWRSKILQKQLPWGLFFDIHSLQKYAPVIEMYQFLNEYSLGNKETELDCVYVLRNDEEMFSTGTFRDKNEIIDCTQKPFRYKKLRDQRYRGFFWGYSNVTSHDVKCVIFHGTTSNLKQNLKPMLYRSVMFDHMEIALHDYYGSKEYWCARRSMRYNVELYNIAKIYRRDYLNSTDINDNTERPDDWTTETSKRTAIGGPYLSVHLRRRDFLVGRAEQMPTIKNVAAQLREKLKEFGLNVVFVSTDTKQYEFDELKQYLSEYTVLKYEPSEEIKNTYKDGGIAIIDQIICSYARYFMGTHESTFTFRIQEEREIIGFPAHTTFNRLCKSTTKCLVGGQWEIVW